MPPRASAPARKFSRPLLLLSADPQIFGQANSAAAGSPAPNTADAFVEFATQRSVVGTCRHTSADSTKAYSHAAGSHLTGSSSIPSAAAPEPPATIRRTPRPRVVLRPRFVAASLSKAMTPNVESAPAIE